MHKTMTVLVEGEDASSTTHRAPSPEPRTVAVIDLDAPCREAAATGPDGGSPNRRPRDAASAGPSLTTPPKRMRLHDHDSDGASSLPPKPESSTVGVPDSHAAEPRSGVADAADAPPSETVMGRAVPEADAAAVASSSVAGDPENLYPAGSSMARAGIWGSLCWHADGMDSRHLVHARPHGCCQPVLCGPSHRSAALDLSAGGRGGDARRRGSQ